MQRLGLAVPGGPETRSRKRRQEPSAEEEAAAEEGGSQGQGRAAHEAAPGQRRGGRRRGAEVVVPTPAQLCFSPSHPRVRLAVAGYQQKHWHRPGSYYQGLPVRLAFERYSREFDCVELNATFYGWHSEATYDSWRERAAAVRPSFEYIVKASRMYTHKKRLNVDEFFVSSWDRFWARCERLRPHLGPVLFQLPPNFGTTSLQGRERVSNIDKLRALGQVLPRGQKFVFEFRDAGWYCDEVYQILRENDWCLAMVDVSDPGGTGWAGTLGHGPNPPPGRYPLDCASWGVYVRFHGSTGQYEGAYGRAAMERWAARAKAWLEGGRAVYFVFNNTDSGTPPAAIADARDLAAALRANGVF